MRSLYDLKPWIVICANVSIETQVGECTSFICIVLQWVCGEYGCRGGERAENQLRDTLDEVKCGPKERVSFSNQGAHALHLPETGLGI